RHLVEGQTFQQEAHVLERRDGDAHLSDFSFRARVIGVEAHLRGQVKGARQARLTGAQEKLESLVSGFGRTETRVLAHGPEFPSVHRLLDPSGKGVRTGFAELR